MSLFRSNYDYFFKEIADPRVYDWPFMSDPGAMLGVIGLYVYSIYVALPRYMADRKPFKLKRVILGYNILQIVSCAIIIYGISTSGWTTNYSLGCQEVDYSNNEQAVRMAGWVWWTMCLKMVELVETVFFVLRKKYNQVSPLHVYHHISTLTIAWLCVKYIAGGMSTFSIIINSFIHILMYSYYFLASLGPHWQERLAKWKPKLTMLQMIQFCIIIAHAAQGLKADCRFPPVLIYFFIPNVCLIFYMFYDFYRKAYRKQKKMA